MNSPVYTLSFSRGANCGAYSVPGGKSTAVTLRPCTSTTASRAGIKDLVRWCVGVDVQTIGHAKVKIDLGRVARRNIYLFRVKELHRRGIASLIGATGQRQGLVL